MILAHDHVHSLDCEHKLVAHDDHHDYMHDGHLHHVTASGVVDHVLAIDADHPDACTPEHFCNEHAADHVHSENCGHAMVPHGDHVGYLVDGHLHRAHNGHCDYHGRLTV